MRLRSTLLILTAAIAAAPGAPAVAKEAMTTICRPVTRCGSAAGPERFCRTVNRCRTVQYQRRVPVQVLKCSTITHPKHTGRRCVHVTRYRYKRISERRCEPRTVCGQRRRPSAGACATVNVCRRVPVRLVPSDPQD